MKIRPYVISLSALALLGLAGAANAHAPRHGHGYDKHYGQWSGHRHARSHRVARHYNKKRARHFRRHHRRWNHDYRRHGIDLYFDGFSVRLHEDRAHRRHRY